MALVGDPAGGWNEDEGAGKGKGRGSDLVERERGERRKAQGGEREANDKELERIGRRRDGRIEMVMGAPCGESNGSRGAG